MEPYNRRAYIWASCPDAKHRDGKRAVESATQACERTEWKDAYTLDALAAASAETGDFAAAVKYEDRALGLLPQGDSDVSDFQARLGLYKAGKPFRDQPGSR
jgi:hypothetical protein